MQVETDRSVTPQECGPPVHASAPKFDTTVPHGQHGILVVVDITITIIWAVLSLGEQVV